MRIALIVPDLRGGGVERVCLLLTREFLARGHDVDLVLLKKRGVLLEQLPNGARVIDLQAERIRQGFSPLVRYLKASSPDAILASMWPLTTLSIIAARFARYPGRVVVSEHSTLSHSPEGRGMVGVALRASMKWVNGRVGAVVGVSNGVIQDLHRLGLPVEQGVTIHNPVEISLANALPKAWETHPWVKAPEELRLLAVGSLKPAKDYPTLLKAVKQLVENGTPVRLLILGTGPLEGELKVLRQFLGLTENVFFGGFQVDPGPFYRAAGLFVLSSAWEGFGNVIVEALAAGTPVVSTDCSSGPSEILECGHYGRLVPVGDEATLASVIRESLATTHDYDTLRTRAADFSGGKVAEEYLRVLSA